MIHWANLLRILGFFILAMALTIGAPLGYALWTGDTGIVPLAAAAGVSALLGAALAFGFRREMQEFNNRDGILLVILTWTAAAVLGALPFCFSPFAGFTDAVFESISGFTTTGATILGNIESLPRSLLLWRSLTQWVGGMGIILLGIAILPLIGTGGMELYRAEFSGASSEKIKPRIAETALSLWRIYAALSVAEYLALRWVGMTPFDAICHTFTTMATGGFSTRNASVEAFHSPSIEVVIIIFMFLAGINFTQLYRLLIQRRPLDFIRDLEVRTYTLVVAASIVVLAVALHLQTRVHGLEALRHSAFQVVSIITTTGYSSTDFEVWPAFAQLVLLALMFAGGCTGSTAGGLKIARVALLKRVVGREFRRIVERRGIFAVRYSGKAVGEPAIQSLLNLIYLAFLINFTACLLLTAFGVDILTSISAVASAMFNVGPGLGTVGPAENYGHLAAPVKWILSFCMLAGRLEFYTLLVIGSRSFWQK